MREAQKRGEKLNLTEDEIAFYDALEVNDSAVQVLGDDTLKEHCPRTRGNCPQQYNHRLDGAGNCPCQIAGDGEENFEEIRLSARQAGEGNNYCPEQAEVIARDWAGYANEYETPVKPFLRAVIDELSLPVEFTSESGVEKNTQALGKDVINALKPSPSNSKESKKRVLAKREIERFQFWEKIIEKHKQRGSFFSKISPGKESWIQTSAGKSGIFYAQVIMMNAWRVELYIGTPTLEVNKRYFDKLFDSREEIESTFGNPLDWQRLEARQGCRICYSVEGKGLIDKEDWDEIQDQMVEKVYALRNALQDKVEKLN
jgi:hypothetical protein